MKKLIHELRTQMYMPLIMLIIFVMSFIVDPADKVFTGYVNIFMSPSILITDYIAVGGLGATLLNVSLIMLFNYIMLKLMKLKVTGPIFSGLMIIMGFSFFGKNIMNTLPIYLGIFLFSKMKKMHFRNFIISLLFSTGLSPLVSYSMFGLGLPLYYSIPLGIAAGIVAGFLTPAFASHTVIFHQGYNLYNTGFALGIISLLFYAVYKALNLPVQTVSLICNDYHYILLGLLIFFSVFAILVSIIFDREVFKKYLELTKRSGRLVSDFIRDFGREPVLLNFGILGILCISIVLIFQIPLNGPIFGTIITVMGFASYGIHIRNIIPVYLGAIAGTYFRGTDFTVISAVIAVFFSSGLAPVSGRYGIIVGFIAGFLHVLVVPFMIDFQGGFDLYNNGLAASFVASVVVTIAEEFAKRRELKSR